MQLLLKFQLWQSIHNIFILLATLIKKVWTLRDSLVLETPCPSLHCNLTCYCLSLVTEAKFVPSEGAEKSRRRWEEQCGKLFITRGLAKRGAMLGGCWDDVRRKCAGDRLKVEQRCFCMECWRNKFDEWFINDVIFNWSERLKLNNYYIKSGKLITFFAIFCAKYDINVSFSSVIERKLHFQKLLLKNEKFLSCVNALTDERNIW